MARCQMPDCAERLGSAKERHKFELDRRGLRGTILKMTICDKCFRRPKLELIEVILGRPLTTSEKARIAELNALDGEVQR